MMLEWWSAIFQGDIIDNLDGYSQISEDFIQTDTGYTCFRWEFTSTRQGRLTIISFTCMSPGIGS